MGHDMGGPYCKTALTRAPIGSTLGQRLDQARMIAGISHPKRLLPKPSWLEASPVHPVVHAGHIPLTTITITLVIGNLQA